MPDYRHLNYLTLQTGDLRRSYRSEVRDDIVLECQELLLAALDSAAPIARMRGYTLTAGAVGPGILARVDHGGVPVQWLAIARRERNTLTLWQLLMQQDMLPAHKALTGPPHVPFVVSALCQGIATCEASDVMALGDFGRCLGWAWVERQRQAA